MYDKSRRKLNHNEIIVLIECDDGSSICVEIYHGYRIRRICNKKTAIPTDLAVD